MTDRITTAATTRNYVPYSDDLEQIGPREEEQIENVVATLRKNNEWAFKKHNHAIRDAHAKSHGVLRGELITSADLPEHLRQGLFAAPATHPVIARLSSTAGAIRSDNVRGVRAMAIKVLGVTGTRLLPEDHGTSQDFLLVNSPSFPSADIRHYRRSMPLAWLLARTPDSVMNVISAVLRGASKMPGPVRIPVPMVLSLFARPNTHVLGETYYTAAPLRFGKYIAQIRVAPLSDGAKALTGQLVPSGTGDNVHRDTVVDFFRTNTASYAVQAQLCTDLRTMPIENAKVAWPQSESPFQTVATLNFPLQNAYSPARSAYADDVLAFNPWNGITAHKPLGSINRLKIKTYQTSSDFRHKMNKVEFSEPINISEVPD
ncbi:catalase family protein [Rhodococcus koreensis]|uniref:catalase family protein n=1 Tax=Rhodococcus koreensis TaxID=99653 RepID=UPI0036712352